MADRLTFRHDQLTQIAEGDEGIIYTLVGDDELVIKILWNPPDDLEARIDAMLSLPPANWGGDSSDPQHLFLAWPGAVAALHSESGISGLVMPRIHGATPLVEMLSPSPGRPRTPPSAATWVTMARNVAFVMDRLHTAGVVVGDVSARNLLVSGNGLITFVDTDSMQFSANGRLFVATRYTPEYAPPAYQKNPGSYNQAGDLFGLAVLMVQILLGGDHPFEGAPASGGNSSISENILANRNRISSPGTLKPVPRQAADRVLSANVLQLARTAFTSGAAAPTARQWFTEVDRELAQLKPCTVSSNHHYPRAIATCPWCAGPDLFPGGKPVSRPAAAAPVAPIRKPTTPAATPVPSVQPVRSTTPKPTAPRQTPTPTPTAPKPPPPARPTPRATPPVPKGPSREDAVAWAIIAAIAIVFIIAAFNR